MKFLFILSCFFFVMFAESQTNSIIWGPEYKISKIIKDPLVFGKVDNRYFVLHYYYKKIYLEAYNETTLIRENSVLIKPEFDGRDLTILSAFMFANKPTFLLAGLNKAGTQFHYFLQSYDVTNLLGSPLVEVGTRNYSGITMAMVIKHPAFLAIYSNDLIFTVNSDQTELVLGISRTDVKQYASALDLPQSSYNLIHVNSDFEIMSKEVLKWPIANFGRSRTIITESNELVVTGSDYKIEFENGKEEVIPGKDYIIKFDFETGAIDSAEIFFGPNKRKSYMLYEADDGSILLAGLTSSNFSGVGGVYTMKYSSDLILTKTSVVEFEKGFVSNTWSKNEEKENTALSYYSYSITDLMLTEDKSTILILEQFDTKSSTHTVSGSSSKVTSYIYGDIIVIKQNSKGELLWKVAVRKYQYSVNDLGRYSSFFAFLDGDDLRLIFNEEKKDMIEPYTNAVNEIPGRGFFGNMVTIDEDGKMTKEKLFDFSDDESMKMIPTSCQIIDANNIFFYVRNNSISMMGKLKI